MQAAKSLVLAKACQNATRRLSLHSRLSYQLTSQGGPSTISTSWRAESITIRSSSSSTCQMTAPKTNSSLRMLIIRKSSKPRSSRSIKKSKSTTQTMLPEPSSSTSFDRGFASRNKSRRIVSDVIQVLETAVCRETSWSLTLPPAKVRWHSDERAPGSSENPGPNESSIPAIFKITIWDKNI